MNHYLAITLGSIGDTLQLTSTPAGLWAASYLFSELSKRICVKLREKGHAILTPWFPEGEFKSDGVGLFPDRIILEQGSASLATLQPLIDAAIDEVGELLAMDENDAKKLQGYLHSYLQVHAVAFETEGNPINDSKGFLAAAELERSFDRIDKGTLLHQLERRDEDRSKNWPVKNSKLVDALDTGWPLWHAKYNEDRLREDWRIRDLGDIASDGRADYDEKEDTYDFKELLKKSRYYAVIQADGDNIGKAVCGLVPKKISKFSESCWKYAREAAQLVQDFHGIPIYVGGDDLLAITPVENADGKNVFWLMQELRDVFDKTFEAYKQGPEPPALSFGVSIQYYKFPLYESLKQAGKLLFEHAKEANGKNAIALRLQKHSGQSVDLLFPYGKSELLTKLTAQIDDLPKNQEECEKPNLLLHSIMTHLRLQKAVFEAALDHRVLEHAFKNVFHDGYGNNEAAFIEARELLNLCRGEEAPLVMTDKMLRLKKFFVEPGEEESHG